MPGRGTHAYTEREGGLADLEHLVSGMGSLEGPGSDLAFDPTVRRNMLFAGDASLGSWVVVAVSYTLVYQSMLVLR